MRLILRDDVSGLGARGDVVEVASGYGRNYLIPQGLAMKATEGALAQADSMQRATQQQDAEAREAAEALAPRIVPVTFQLHARVDESGTMFGSIGAVDIAAAVKEATEVDLDPSQFDVDAPFKELGAHYVMARPHPEVAFPVNFEILPQD
jgi:large subunit ribosomal protein L9